MKLTNRVSQVKTIRHSGPDFTFKSGSIIVASRAGFEIAKDCPPDIKEILYDAITYKWINPVAYMRDDEWMWEQLKNE